MLRLFDLVTVVCMNGSNGLESNMPKEGCLLVCFSIHSQTFRAESS